MLCVHLLQFLLLIPQLLCIVVSECFPVPQLLINLFNAELFHIHWEDLVAGQRCLRSVILVVMLAQPFLAVEVGFTESSI